MAIQHFYSQTIADGTATSVVRPSDWNSAHNQVLNMGGNTAGTAQISGADIVWAGGNNVTLSANGSTVTIVGPNTVAQTVQTQASGNIVGVGFTSTTAAGAVVAATHNSAGLLMAVPGFLTTAAQSGHSHNFATTTTGGSNIVVGTANSVGATIGVPAFLTTAAATNITSGRAGTGTTFAGTNVSASVTLDTNGLNMALSGVGGGVINQTGPNIAVAGSTITSGDVLFSNANGVTFGMNGNTITASAAGGGGGGVTRDRKVGPFGGMSSITSVAATGINGSLIFGFEQVVEPLQFTKIAMVQGHSGQTTINASQVMSMTIDLGVYSKVNDTQLTLLVSGSQSFSGFWSSSTVTGYNGMRELYVPIQTTLDVGNYFIARRISVTGNNASAATANTISFFGVPMQSVSAAAEGFGVATNVTQGAFYPFQGVYSTTTNAMPGSVGLSQVTQSGTAVVHGNFYREYVGT